MPRIVVTDLGGSLNQGRAPSELAPGEYSQIRDFYQFGAKLRRRGGTRRLTSAAFSQAFTGIAHVTIAAGGGSVILGSLSSLSAFANGEATAIPSQAGFSMADSERLWTLFQYKNAVYGIREGITGFARTTGADVGYAGIAAPTDPPSLADAGAGDIPAATFKGVYTFYNHNTGLESNPSPVSDALVLGSNKQINWSGIKTSPNAQVTRRRLYRSLANQSGEYFFVAEIGDNTTVIYSNDNVLAEDLGDAVSQVNGTPPSGLLFGTVWKERLFVSDGETVFHSADGLIEAFDPSAEIPVFPDDGHPLRALHAFGERLMIGKTNGIYYITGSDPSTFSLLSLLTRHGCVSHHSMQSAEGNLFWLGTDNVYRSDGNAVVGIGSEKLRTIIEGLDATQIRDASAIVYPRLGWYFLVIPGQAYLVYNYRTNVWTTFTGNVASVVGEFFDADLVQEIYLADTSGHLYRLQDVSYGFDDTASALGNAISASFTTGAFGGEPATEHVISRASLLAPQYSEQITLAILSEGVSIKSRTVSLDYEPRWKLYSLSTRHQAKAQSQLKVTYTGATAIDIEGFALDLEPLGRPAMLAR